MFKFKTLIIIAFFSLCSFAQSSDKIISTAKTIFELSADSDYKKAAEFFIYSDKNQTKYERVINSGNKEEFRSVKKICKKIKGLLKISSSYNFSKISTDKKITTIEVNFLSSGQNLKFNLGFIQLNNEFKLLSFK